tara:strand:+ start:19594 stop:19959 length:366 start_codon:yes stop_codon:yes gene_type:complete
MFKAKYLHEVGLTNYEYEFSDTSLGIDQLNPNGLKIYVNVEGSVLEYEPYDKEYGDSHWEIHTTGLVSLCIIMGANGVIYKEFELNAEESDAFLESYPEIEDALVTQAMNNPDDGEEWLDE